MIAGYLVGGSKRYHRLVFFYVTTRQSAAFILSGGSVASRLKAETNTAATTASSDVTNRNLGYHAPEGKNCTSFSEAYLLWGFPMSLFMAVVPS
jgi:hypothetical protein